MAGFIVRWKFAIDAREAPIGPVIEYGADVVYKERDKLTIEEAAIIGDQFTRSLEEFARQSGEYPNIQTAVCELNNKAIGKTMTMTKSNN